MRCAFIVAYRVVFSVRTMCRCLRVHPSGLSAWLKTPLSKRAWQLSGKVYGYRKLHDDLLDQGETCCPNRVARLARLAGIRAQIGYRRCNRTFGLKPIISQKTNL